MLGKLRRDKHRTRHLSLGVWLEEYRIDAVLGTGGSGITYRAYDSRNRRNVAIKEYFPGSWSHRDRCGNVFCVSEDVRPEFADGLRRFIDEAQLLARLDHPGIVRVERIFRAFGTSFTVLGYVDGPNLLEWSRTQRRRPTADEIILFAYCLLSALEAVHRLEILHCDLAPSNILLNKNGFPIVIDFGSARHAIGKHYEARSIVLTPHYAPHEQYSVSEGRLGPWSDIYSAAAILYFLITGEPPQSAPSRSLSRNRLALRAKAQPELDQAFIAAVEWALEVRPEARPQNVAQWRQKLLPMVEVHGVARGLAMS